jgi:hypothetical protein
MNNINQQIQSFLSANGATAKLETNYSTFGFIADQDAATTHGLSVGKPYTLWVCKKNCLSKNGNQIVKGQWFITEKA